MSELSLTVACNLNERTQPLYDGTVQPDGIDLRMIDGSPSEIFYRMLNFQEFDASEMSMSSYLIARDRGRTDIVALPVFPSRMFRHSFIFVNKNVGIEGPEDLKEKDIGIPEYQMSAAVWIRGMLQHEYGVSPSDATWYQGGQEESGRDSQVQLDLDESIDLRRIPSDETLDRLLRAGDLDALVTSREPASLRSETVERLFPDFVEVEREYYERTGLYPIMHTVVLRTEILERERWVAQELKEAFTEAKDRNLEELRTRARRTSLPWPQWEVERAMDLMGPDFYQYGADANRDTLETMVQYSREQGLIESEIPFDELFAANTYFDHAI